MNTKTFQAMPLQSFSVRGQWWRPSFENDKLPGVLHFDSDNGLKLLLDGAFDMLHATMDNHQEETIFGRTANGTIYSLLKCGYAGKTVGNSFLNDIPRCTEMNYRPALALKGILITSLEEPVFFSLELEFSHTAKWLDHSLVREDYSTRQFTIENAFEKGLGTLDSIAVTLHAEAHATGWNAFEPKREHSFTITQQNGFTCLSTTSLSIVAWLKFVARLQRFLSFATRQAVYPVNIYNGESPDLQVSAPSRDVIVDIFYKTYAVHAEREPSYYEMLIPFSALGSNCTDILGRWQTIEDHLPDIIDLYLGNIYADKINPTFYFLSMAQSLESFHRILRPGKPMTTDEFQALRGRVLANLTQDDGEWLRARFPQNEKFYATRLTELCEEYGGGLFLSQDDRQSFVRQIVDHRNYYTHYTWSRNNSHPVAGEHLVSLGMRGRMLLDACLLSELGFSEQKRLDILRLRMDYFKFLRHLQDV